MLKALFCSTCIFLLAIFSASRLYASDYFSNAFRIFSEGSFFDASIEFERAIFYENDSNRISQYQYYKSLCYKGLTKYDKALEELDKINLNAAPDTLWLLIRYEQAVCSYLDNDVNRAILFIGQIKMRSNDTLLLKNPYIIPLNIICLNANREWDKALKLWNCCLENLMIQDSVKNIFRKEIEELYEKENIPRFYSPEKARKLSCFIPGSGQIYSGAVPEGSFNFLINASLLGYTVWEFYSQYYLTGYFIGLRFFRKFYIGGIKRADNLAMEKNKQEISKFNAANSSLIIRIFNANHP
jgi:tetratricopeptide (TPR) repeat protein